MDKVILTVYSVLLTYIFLLAISSRKFFNIIAHLDETIYTDKKFCNLFKFTSYQNLF